MVDGGQWLQESTTVGFIHDWISSKQCRWKGLDRTNDSGKCWHICQTRRYADFAGPQNVAFMGLRRLSWRRHFRMPSIVESSPFTVSVAVARDSTKCA